MLLRKLLQQFLAGNEPHAATEAADAVEFDGGQAEKQDAGGVQRFYVALPAVERRPEVVAYVNLFTISFHPFQGPEDDDEERKVNDQQKDHPPAEGRKVYRLIG